MKTKTIIALSQAGNKGKTETLRFLANLFISEFNPTIIYPTSKANNPIPAEYDFRLVIEIAVNGKKYVIAIESKGDPKTELEKRLLQVEDKYDCDIIFCSTRTRGETVHAVNNLWKQRGYHTIWTSTYQVSGQQRQRISNELKAQQLLDYIRAIGLI